MDTNLLELARAQVWANFWQGMVWIAICAAVIFGFVKYVIWLARSGKNLAESEWHLMLAVVSGLAAVACLIFGISCIMLNIGRMVNTDYYAALMVQNMAIK